jgi:DNA modification methylase
MFKWFSPKNAHVLDPFAGECTKGVVATYLGYEYTGIEVRQEQIDTNYEIAKKIGVLPNWIKGDSFELDKILPEGKKYDFVFTSPPYYDLEIYSKGEKDGSAFETYEKFMKWYEEIFKQAVNRMNENRFLVVKVGEIRDEKGIYRNFVGHNIDIFTRLGLKYYNEIILITTIGSLPVRIGKQFEGNRKIGKTHQNILVFYKGDVKKIKDNFGILNMQELEKTFEVEEEDINVEDL